MDKKKIFLKLAQYALVAVVGSISLILIAVGAWILCAMAAGTAIVFVIVIPMLVIFGAAVHEGNDACCRKWSLKPRLILLVEFLPMFGFSAVYFAQVLYRVITNKYGGFLSGLSAALDLSASICFLGTTVLVFLSCVVFGAVAKRSKGGDCENENSSK